MTGTARRQRLIGRARLQIPAAARKTSLYLAPASHRRAYSVSMNQVLLFRLALIKNANHGGNITAPGGIVLPGDGRLL